MTQEAPQLPMDPPQFGVPTFENVNKAFESIITDFAGPSEPTKSIFPYSRWADTSTGIIKRRNATNSAWVAEGRLFYPSLPMYPQGSVPTQDIGPIYIIGKGLSEWNGSSYPTRTITPSATFAELDAATSDQGPIRCIDMADSLYVWVSNQYFTGYRNVLCGEIPRNFAPTPRPWELEVIGGVWDEADPKERRVISLFRERGHVVDIADWIKGAGRIASLGNGQWKACDLQDMFFRIAGTDADTANAAPPGFYQQDALQRIVGATGRSVASAGNPSSGAFSSGAQSGALASGGTGSIPLYWINFDSGLSTRAASETRSMSTRVASVILI